jgi:uncharacterized YccA/Bax inhibitor family protein
MDDDAVRRTGAGVLAVLGFGLTTYALVAAAPADGAPDLVPVGLGLALLLVAVGVAVYDRFAA